MCFEAAHLGRTSGIVSFSNAFNHAKQDLLNELLTGCIEMALV